MRLRQFVGISAATALAVLGLPIPAASAAVTTLYVNNAASANCSDAGTGTAARPYCTIGAATRVVEPGQTVQVEGSYPESVTLTRSGTPEQPIVFAGSFRDRWPTAGFGVTNSPTALTTTGVHDVVVRNFRLSSSQEKAVVTDSARVTLDGLLVVAATDAPPAVALRGSSTDLTVSRSAFYNSKGIAIGAGVRNTLVTGNDLVDATGPGISATDAPGTVITHNSLTVGCGTGISLAGASAGSVLKNNIVATKPGSWPCSQPQNGISVATGSATGSTLGHNLLFPYLVGWGGAQYSTPAAFQQASAQGAGDLSADPRTTPTDGAPDRLKLLSRSPAIDAADPTAPRLPEDVFGKGLIDDPTMPNTGPGGTAYDIGAHEFHGLGRVDLGLSVNKGPHPLEFTATATARNLWPTQLSYSYDFGDGSAPVITTAPSAKHTYPTTGRFSVVVTVTDGLGGRVVSPDYNNAVEVTEPAPLVPDFSIEAGFEPLAYSFDPASTTSSWQLTKQVMDYGDGSEPTVNPGFSHLYAVPGDYQVKLTVTDAGGRTESVTKTVKVRYAPAGYLPLSPERFLDTRTALGDHQGKLTAGETLNIWPHNTGNVPYYRPVAVVLNLTVTGATQDGFLTVYPDGAARPLASSINFRAGQTVANLVTVPTGTSNRIRIYNSGGGQVDVIGDIVGYYDGDGTKYGEKFAPVQPGRLLDTRTTGGALDTTPRKVQVTGQAGVPADAKAVLVNLTATQPTTGGYLTAYPSDITRPAVSNLNFLPGQTVSNQALIPIATDGTITVYNPSGLTHVIVDVFGSYGPSGTSLFTPLTPTRVADTRTTGKLTQNTSLTVSPAAAPTGATAAVLNLTVTEPEGPGYLTTHATGTPRPPVSNLNFTTGATLSNHTTTPVDATGRFTIDNPGSPTHAIADLLGWFTAA
ncbi:hypothetical protein F4556_005365 [Kitasatospora gansuensis]|uniref:PKD domain-containing protein n=1 Tax=Kitasatospora gansuensis TaxID=258050 RepID=A0A7W7WKB0_9ACTN|nr:PKD domain-containing protein [Kitasatospora gansuensis]MBB4949830.1 hypothetical protein [Kitasatospora gansuensis]